MSRECTERGAGGGVEKDLVVEPREQAADVLQDGCLAPARVTPCRATGVAALIFATGAARPVHCGTQSATSTGGEKVASVHVDRPGRGLGRRQPSSSGTSASGESCCLEQAAAAARQKPFELLGVDDAIAIDIGEIKDGGALFFRRFRPGDDAVFVEVPGHDAFA